MILIGTLVNTLAVLAGSATGLLLAWLAGRFSSVLPAGSIKLGERLQTIIMQGVALCVLFLGISGSLSGQNSLITILAMVLGAIIGELLDLDKRMMALGDWVQVCSFVWGPWPLWGPFRMGLPETIPRCLPNPCWMASVPLSSPLLWESV